MPKYDVHTVINFSLILTLQMCGNILHVYRPITKRVDVKTQNTFIKSCKLLQFANVGNMYSQITQFSASFGIPK